MKQNNSMKEIGQKLAAAQSVVLFPHISTDGDALGSCVALCAALRNAGKQAYILMEEETPEYVGFLDQGYCTQDQDIIEEPDICMCVDCSETKRFPGRRDAFFKGRTTICIDHHVTSEPFADYNYIDGGAAATCELIYKLLTVMEVEITKEIAEALYTGISTDTGNFQYSNTTKETHLIAAELLDAGIDHNKLTVLLYQNTKLERLRITCRVLDTMEIFAEGKAAIACVTQQMLDEEGCAMEDAEGSIDLLRNIMGVEIAAILKERGPGVIKASMRAKTTANVAEIAAKFGGGGHIKAAGCTFETDMQAAWDELKEAIEESLRN